MVASEKETDGFLAPSITILAREGWKGNTTLEKCQKRLSKLNFCLGQKLLKTPLKDLSKKIDRIFNALRDSQITRSSEILMKALKNYQASAGPLAPGHLVRAL